jgi:hypothetical protein
LFSSDDPQGSRCPVCSWALDRRHSNCKRVYMWPVGSRVRNMFRQPVLREALRQNARIPRRPEWIDDINDGALYEELARRTNLRDKFWAAIPCKISHDPADVNTTGSKSLTPVFATPMSLGSQLRNKRGAYFILMLLPQGFKNLSLALEVYFALPDNPWGEDNGTPVHWVPEEGEEDDRVQLQGQTSTCIPIMDSADTRALPAGSCAMQSSTRGSCAHCWCLGASVSNADGKGMYYLSAFSRCDEVARTRSLNRTTHPFIHLCLKRDDINLNLTR